MKRKSDRTLLYPSRRKKKRTLTSPFIDSAKKIGIGVAKSRIGDSLFAPVLKTAPRSSLYLAATLRLRAAMAHLLAAHPEVLAPYFRDVKRFCIFLATSRSGHSIIAHLLTAHPKVQISDELAAVSLIEQGYDLNQVAALIKFQDYIHIRRNRRKSGYDYRVNGASQNVYDKYPEVIGDAKGARSINLLGGEDGFLPLLRSKLKMPLRVIVHLRNPFDAISTKARKGGIKLHRAVDAFIEKERIMSRAYESLSEEERLVQRHEDVIADPEFHFIRMFEFLGVEPTPEVVKACAEKIWKKPNVTRKQIDWPRREVDTLKDFLGKSRLFHSYLES